MADTPNTIALSILGREYRINCPDGAESELKEAARYLHEKMEDIKTASSSAGKVVSTDRIAIIAALNITHELLSKDKALVGQKESVESMHRLLDEMLEQDVQLEL